MGQIISIRDKVDDAWSDYQRLAQEVTDDPKLFLDRRHCEARIRAFNRFGRLYLVGGQA